jgi:hypothetical protein
MQRRASEAAVFFISTPPEVPRCEGDPGSSSERYSGISEIRLTVFATRDFSGWSEAATAGASKRRLFGPIWAKGVLVTDIRLGEFADPPAGDRSDIPRAAIPVGTTGVLAAGIAVVLAAIRI